MEESRALSQIHLQSNISQRTCIYGGALDPISVEYGLETERFLKFSALFYEHVVVPDAWFQSYGPLYNQLALAAAQPDSWDTATSLLPCLLREGVLVPALRFETTTVGNWRACMDIGRNPGKSNLVTENDCLRTLKFVDSVATKFARRPNASRLPRGYFADCLYGLVCGEDSRYKELLMPHGWLRGTKRATRFVDNLFGLIAENQSNRDLRGGRLEDVIAEYLKVPTTHLYATLGDANNLEPHHHHARLALSLVQTCYGATQSHELGVVGGLYRGHERGAVDAGLYNRILEPSDGPSGGLIDELILGKVNVDRATPKTIIEIRRSDEFRHYIHLLGGVHAAAEPGVAFESANPEFIEHLERVYLPHIAKAMGAKPIVPRVVSFGAATMTIAAFGVLAPGADVLSGAAVFTIVSNLGEAALREAAKVAPRSLEDWVAARMHPHQRWARRNNYALWRAGTTSYQGNEPPTG